MKPWKTFKKIAIIRDCYNNYAVYVIRKNKKPYHWISVSNKQTAIDESRSLSNSIKQIYYNSRRNII